MAELTAKKRNNLADSQFALPEERKYPLSDADHVRNAAARLAQMIEAGKIAPKKASEAKKRIAAAAKRYGIASKFAKDAAKR